jgi:DNA polymerase-1
LLKIADPRTHRVHTTYNQAGAATGRLSSNDPNLQNIPIRTYEGRRIRSVFVAERGWELISADYSQIELRILAHLSGDERFIAAFAAGEDIHRRTAMEVITEGAEPDAEGRRRAKAVNFGIVYGQTPFGLARSLGISREEAGDFIDRYFARYPGVRDYIEHSLAEARERGATRTLFGRIRQIPEINSRNPMRRSGAERMAINAPIQGSAADIIKLAMIRIADELERGRLSTRMVLQVHDELIFEIPEAEMGIAENLRDWMSGVAELKVPLVVDVKAGPNWRDMTPIPQPNPAERARPSG